MKTATKTALEIEDNTPAKDTDNPLVKWRAENPNYKVKRLDPVEKAKANPRSKTLAIKAYCWECCGGDKEEVKHCPVVICPLHSHRPWVSKTKEDKDEDDCEDSQD